MTPNNSALRSPFHKSIPGPVRSIKLYDTTRHENFHGKFSLCAEYLSRSIGQKLKCRLKVFTDYSEGHI